MDRYFSYCTGGVFTLSEVLAKATGMRTDRYAQEKLFGPLGITDAVWVYSPLNVPQTGGGLRLTGRDLLKIAELYRAGGEWRREANRGRGLGEGLPPHRTPASTRRRSTGTCGG